MNSLVSRGLTKVPSYLNNSLSTTINNIEQMAIIIDIYWKQDFTRQFFLVENVTFPVEMKIFAIKKSLKTDKETNKNTTYSF